LHRRVHALCEIPFEPRVSAVEDDDDLPRLRGLSGDAVQCTVEELRATTRGDHHTDVGMGPRSVPLDWHGSWRSYAFARVHAAIMQEVSHASPKPGSAVCRFCGDRLTLTMVDLGMSPLCESLIEREALERAETFYPLHVRVCESCWLAQLPEVVAPDDIFSEYAYFSAYSDSWVAHARSYVESMVDRLSLGPESFVVEIASNDGYLLQHFVQRGIPILGIDPARNVAEVAIAKGVPTLVEFFGLEVAENLASQGRRADLVLGNNVLAQVPDINDFVAGVHVLLSDGGTATFEFPHLARLLERIEYDTIYHEHFSYFSLHTIQKIFEAHGLTVVDVDELPTHGGSLRIYAAHLGEGRQVSPSVERLEALEQAAGLCSRGVYERFTEAVHESKRSLLELLIDLRRKGRQVVGYGAPGKGNTLLNYCGIRTDLIKYTVDRNPYKHGKYTPGTHIPIHSPEEIRLTQPDAIVLLPWNLAKEISEQLAYAAAWGAKLIVPIPSPRVLEPGSLT
jgi:SAM-dependent methyltransferase